jgi:hypothetical protein
VPVTILSKTASMRLPQRLGSNSSQIFDHTIFQG